MNRIPTRTLLSTLLGGLVVAAAVAVAGDDTSARADTDNDGRISAQEHAAAAQAKFQRMDANHDGKLTADERSQRRAGAEDAGPHRGGKAKMDADNDGAVTRAEHAAGAKAMFDRMDANHDGRLAADEMPQRRRGGADAGTAGHGMGMMDADKDGVVTRAEHAAAMQAMFDRKDADHDGKLVAAEMEAAPRAGHAGMARHEGGGMKPGMDGDKDGTVTAAEYAALARARFARMDGDHDGYLSKAEMSAGRKK
jgi:Ca2+-binding EF-hand superfamily protein